MSHIFLNDTATTEKDGMMMIAASNLKMITR